MFRHIRALPLMLLDATELQVASCDAFSQMVNWVINV